MNSTDVLPLIANPSVAYYEEQVKLLFEACRAVDSEMIRHVQKYHPHPEKLTDINKASTDFSTEDARLTIAREHGFCDYEELIRHIEALTNPQSAIARFEAAVDAVVEGDAGLLKSLLAAEPALVFSQSDRGHGATLLHYIAANGVENYRQKTSDNALEIAEILLAAGSKPDAVADTYGNKLTTTLELLSSSIYPARAGLQSALIEKLLDYGAAVNGIRDDGSPLVTAIYFHYADAAQTLVRRGARVDNIVTAAALGNVELVEKWISTGGKLKEAAPLMQVSWMRQESTPENNLALAFVWAAMQNRIEVVRLMLDRGVNPAVCDQRQWTALHWAGFYAYTELVELLIERKAPLEARNEFGGTVLDQTLWATNHGGLQEAHLSLILKLLDAGARIHPWWLFDHLTPPLDPRVLNLLYDHQL